jgi:hypothetical protein
MHYKRLLKHGTTDRALYICKVDGCNFKREGLGYCQSHYRRFKKYNDPLGGPPSPVRGNRKIDKQGYVIIYINGVSYREHRYVMELHLNRSLTKDESVHHRNGDRSDNRISNLELWSRYQPSGQRVSDKVAWAKELLALYEPSVLEPPGVGG